MRGNEKTAGWNANTSATYGLLRYWLPLVLWMALIFALSHVPGDEYPDVKWPFLSYAAHVTLYTVLGLLLMRALARQWGRVSLPRHSASAFAIGLLWGVGDEFHQVFVPFRTFQIGDIVADAIGLLIGILLYLLLRKTLFNKYNS